jgi:hypothetical protein
MFTKRRLSAEGYLALQRKCQVWGFVSGVMIGMVLTYVAPWMPWPTEQLTTWLILVAAIGAFCSVAGAYLADMLTDDSELIPPPAPSEAVD